MSLEPFTTALSESTRKSFRIFRILNYSVRDNTTAHSVIQNAISLQPFSHILIWKQREPRIKEAKSSNVFDSLRKDSDDDYLLKVRNEETHSWLNHQKLFIQSNYKNHDGSK